MENHRSSHRVRHGTRRAALYLAVRTCAILLASCLPLALGQEATLHIELPAEPVPEGAVLKGRLTGSWATGKLSEEQQVLRLVWVDGAGRVVSHAEIRSEKRGPQAAIEFAVPLGKGFGCRHRMLALAAKRPRKRNEEIEGWRIAAEASFRIRTAPDPWLDYLVLAPAAQASEWERLHALGIRGLGPVEAAGDLATLPDAPFLCEALPSHHPLAPAPDLAWQQALAAFEETRDPSVVLRTPLFDENLLAKARSGLEQRLREHAWRSPLGYSLGEGLSAGRGAAPLDFKADPFTLQVFRAWLRGRYPHLGSLNAHWESNFASWTDVVPPSTDLTKARNDAVYAERLAGLNRENLHFRLELEHLRAPGGENFAAWCDWRAFQDFAFARLVTEYRGWVRGLDPSARVGLRGIPKLNTWSGHDWWLLRESVDWVVAGEAGALERAVLHSFRPGMRCLMPLRLDHPAARRQVWASWIEGDAGALVDGAESLLKEDRLEPPARALSRDLRLLHEGLSHQRALLDAEPAPIAVYYSPRSQSVHWQLDSRPDGSNWINRGGEDAATRDSARLAANAWLALLRDLGYRARFVHPEQMLSGKLEAKVLVLPKALCLSGAEADAIRAFVRLGGVALADSQCGVFDGSGRRRRQPGRREGLGAGALDSAFGIRRTDFFACEFDGGFHGDTQIQRAFLADPATRRPLGPLSETLRVNEPGLRATGAVRLGRTLTGLSGEGDPAAAVLVRSGGLGRFVYLNLALQDYPRQRREDAGDFAFHGLARAEYARRFGEPSGGEALRIVVGDVLAETLGDAPLIVSDVDGLPLRGVRRAYWTRDGATLAALLPPGGATGGEGLDDDFGLRYLPASPLAAPRTARVRMDRSAHWYDLRSGAYLGEGVAARTTLDPQAASLLAALPYKVEALQMRVRRTDPAGVYRLAVGLATLGEAPPVPHVLRIQVFDPDGCHLPHYDQGVVAEHGVWEGDFALALNEPAGTFRLFVRDVLSGVRAEAHLLKDAAYYGELFPAHARLQTWTERPAREAERLDLEQDGTLVLRRRVAFEPSGPGLTAPPALEVDAPSPWRLAHFGAPNYRPRHEPEPRTYMVDVVFHARPADLRPDDPEDLALTLRAGEKVTRQAVPLRVAVVPPEAEGGIEIDGKLKDRGWGRRAQAGGFVRVEDGAPADEETHVYLRRGKDGLFVGVKCKDDRFRELRARKIRAAGRDDPSLHEGDWFELAIASAASEPLRIRIDPRGNLCDQHGGDAAWNLSADARIATRQDGDDWTAELALPWKDLGFEKPPAEGTCLRLGFERNRWLDEARAERSAWRMKPRAESTPENFGLAMTVGE